MKISGDLTAIGMLDKLRVHGDRNIKIEMYCLEEGFHITVEPNPWGPAVGYGETLIEAAVQVVRIVENGGRQISQRAR